MTKRRFIQCDVFTSTPGKGNGLAVVVDGDGLSDDEMQTFAAWTNLAETTFLFPPTDPRADYKVRIFTPGREMPFAGHPTLGSCAAWLKTGGVPASANVIRQECGVGIVDIDLGGRVPAFVAPSTTVEPLVETETVRICNALQLNPESIVRAAQLNNGPVWQVLELKTADDVLSVDASRISWPEFVGVGLVGPYPSNQECDLEVRNISPSSGMIEDPITGSLNAAIAQWMQSEGRLQSDLLVSQGTNINRCGRVYIQRDKTDPDRVLIGGETQIMIEGTVEF